MRAGIVILIVVLFAGLTPVHAQECTINILPVAMQFGRISDAMTKQDAVAELSALRALRDEANSILDKCDEALAASADATEMPGWAGTHGHKRSDPVPFGLRQSIDVSLSFGSDSGPASVQILNYNPDETARFTQERSDMAVTIGPDVQSGQHVATVQLDYFCDGDSDGKCFASASSFKLVGHKGKIYDSTFIDWYGTGDAMFGGSHMIVGTAFMVDDDDGDLVLYYQPFIGTSTYFALG